MDIIFCFYSFSRVEFFVEIIFDRHYWNFKCNVKNCTEGQCHNDVTPELVKLCKEIKVERLFLRMYRDDLIDSVNEINTQTHSADWLPLS